MQCRRVQGGAGQGVHMPKPPALHPMPAAAPVVDDFNYVDSGSEGPEEVRSDSSLEVLDEEEELGRSTQGWD